MSFVDFHVATRVFIYRKYVRATLVMSHDVGPCSGFAFDFAFNSLRAGGMWGVWEWPHSPLLTAHTPPRLVQAYSSEVCDVSRSSMAICDSRSTAAGRRRPSHMKSYSVLRARHHILRSSPEPHLRSVVITMPSSPSEATEVDKVLAHRPVRDLVLLRLHVAQHVAAELGGGGVGVHASLHDFVDLGLE